jgi:hypothetical protein
MGNNIVLLDLGGNSRVFTSTVDIVLTNAPAFDSNGYVDIKATGKKDGGSWLNAYCDKF